MKNPENSKKLKFFKLWFTLGCLLVGLVIFFSLSPSQPDITPFSHSDKIIHILVYAFIMFYFGCIYLPERIYRRLGIGFILMGFVLELIQGLIGYRTMEYLDMLANSTGVLIGWLSSKTPLSSILIYSETRLEKLRKNNNTLAL